MNFNAKKEAKKLISQLKTELADLRARIIKNRRSEFVDVELIKTQEERANNIEFLLKRNKIQKALKILSCGDQQKVSKFLNGEFSV